MTGNPDSASPVRVTLTVWSRRECPARIGSGTWLAHSCGHPQHRARTMRLLGNEDVVVPCRNPDRDTSDAEEPFPKDCPLRDGDEF